MLMSTKDCTVRNGKIYTHLFLSHRAKIAEEKESITYAFTAAATFQLYCFSSFDALFLSDCVTCVNSEIALFCVEDDGPGILTLDRELRW